MLQTLKIENVALIDRAVLEFDSKLNVISGETGAGKSIMLDSLSFVFGGRADRSLIRSGESRMRVEAIFSMLNPVHTKFIVEELGIDCTDEMFLSRELDINGKNTCKINGELVPVNSVKKICSRLIDIHGQSEHLAILDNDYQLSIIDLFSKGVGEKLTELNKKIDQVKAIETEVKNLGGSESERANLIDLYTYQLNEIESLNIKENEFENLQTELKAMQQFEKINSSLQTAYENCTKNQYGLSAMDSVVEASKALQQISDLGENYSALFERLNSLSIDLTDIVDSLHETLYNNVFDEARFNFVDERIDTIKSAFRKYGGNFEKLKQYEQDIAKKLDNLTNSELKRQELEEKKDKILLEIEKIQSSITELRKKSAENLSKKMQQELQFLGMPNARLNVEFTRIAEKYSSMGADRVEFMFSSNLGFEPKPLNKVVSGGEMSRVMLAYKIVVSEVDDISTIIFDEVDSGLSGNIATVVAKYLAKLSTKKQVIAISHLPQICAMADHNIKVEKFSDKTTTHTRATILTGATLLKEIARLMGAVEGTDGIKVSSELKSKSNEYKESLEQ